MNKNNKLYKKIHLNNKKQKKKFLNNLTQNIKSYHQWEGKNKNNKFN